MLYLDRCKAAADSINPEMLAELTFNEVIKMGGSFTFRGLGEIPVLGATEFIGLKLPKTLADDPQHRVIAEVASLSLLTTVAPGLMPKLPKFTCYLQASGEEAGALLTEDATSGGLKNIRPMRASAETRRLLYEPFKAYGTMDEVLEVETLDIATASNVEGEERLLDFTPDPISGSILYVGGVIDDYIGAADRAIPELTITIRADTPLGSFLVTRYQGLA